MTEPTTLKAKMHCVPRWDFFYITRKKKHKKELTYHQTGLPSKLIPKR